MKKKSSFVIGSSIALIGVLLAVAIFFGITTYYAENDVANTSESNPIYIPSNITKANPNILVGSGEGSWRTTNVSDLSDGILFTVQGTVLHIGNPIEWFESGPTGRGHGTVPITISVDQVYKGNIDSETFTFFIDGLLVIDGLKLGDNPSDSSPENRTFYLFPWEPQFELGEQVLVHINEIRSNNDRVITVEDLEILTPNYSVQLGKYGKYVIQNEMLFNEKFPAGISKQIAINQSSP